MVGQMIPCWKREFGVMKWHQTRKPKERTQNPREITEQNNFQTKFTNKLHIPPNHSDMKGWFTL